MNTPALLLQLTVASLGSAAAQDVTTHRPGISPINAEYVAPYSARYSSYDITVRATRTFGRNVLSVIVLIDRGNGVIVDHMGWDAETLEMVYRQTPYFAKGIEYVVSRFEGGKHEITRIPLRGGQPIFVTGDVGSPVFEVAFLGIILGALPLELGFQVRLPHLVAQRESDDWRLDFTIIEVTGREEISTPAGDFDAWVVDTDNETFGEERLYIVNHPPFVVRRIRWPGTAREFVSEVQAVEREGSR